MAPYRAPSSIPCTFDRRRHYCKLTKLGYCANFILEHVQHRVDDISNSFLVHYLSFLLYQITKNGVPKCTALSDLGARIYRVSQKNVLIEQDHNQN